MINNKMDNLHSKALKLSYFTVGYNIIECIISIFAGFLAGSTALLGFGSDSLVESLSGTIMIWRFRKHGILSKYEEDEIEKKATFYVGIIFFIFGAYILYESIRKLLVVDKPEPSPVAFKIEYSESGEFAMFYCQSRYYNINKFEVTVKQLE